MAEVTRGALPPGARMVLFDGGCGLCQRSVRWFLHRDRHARLLFAPLQGETARKVLATVGVGPGGEASRERLGRPSLALPVRRVRRGGRAPWNPLGVFLRGPEVTSSPPAEGRVGEGRPIAPDTVLLLERDAGGQLVLHDRTAAIARALVALGGRWAFLGWALLAVPRPLADAVYRFIAARRHRLGMARCELPADRTRFLP